MEVCPEPFSGASGLAAGFLISNWYASAMLPLATLSFSLHKSMADNNNGSEVWGYSSSTAISLGPHLIEGRDFAESSKGRENWLFQGASRAQVERRNEHLDKGKVETPSWLRVEDGQNSEVMGGAESTAQM